MEICSVCLALRTNSVRAPMQGRYCLNDQSIFACWLAYVGCLLACACAVPCSHRLLCMRCLRCMRRCMRLVLALLGARPLPPCPSPGPRQAAPFPLSPLGFCPTPVLPSSGSSAGSLPHPQVPRRATPDKSKRRCDCACFVSSLPSGLEASESSIQCVTSTRKSMGKSRASGSL